LRRIVKPRAARFSRRSQKSGADAAINREMEIDGERKRRGRATFRSIEMTIAATPRGRNAGTEISQIREIRADVRAGIWRCQCLTLERAQLLRACVCACACVCVRARTRARARSRVSTIVPGWFGSRHSDRFLIERFNCGTTQRAERGPMILPGRCGSMRICGGER